MPFTRVPYCDEETTYNTMEKFRSDPSCVLEMLKDFESSNPVFNHYINAMTHDNNPSGYRRKLMSTACIVLHTLEEQLNSDNLSSYTYLSLPSPDVESFEQIVQYMEGDLDELSRIMKAERKANTLIFEVIKVFSTTGRTEEEKKNMAFLGRMVYLTLKVQEDLDNCYNLGIDSLVDQLD